MRKRLALALFSSASEARAACGGALVRHEAEGWTTRIAAVKPSQVAARLAKERPEILYLPESGPLVDAARAALANGKGPREVFTAASDPGRATIFVEVAASKSPRARLAGAHSGFRAAETFRLLRRVES